MINNSFASVLIARWEQLLQNVSETVHNATGLYFCYQIIRFVFDQTNSSVYSGLRDQMNKLRDSLANLQRAGEDEEQEKELDLRMKNIKVVLLGQEIWASGFITPRYRQSKLSWRSRKQCCCRSL